MSARIYSSIASKDSYSKRLFKSGSHFKTEEQAIEAEAEISSIFLAVAGNLNSCMANYVGAEVYAERVLDVLEEIQRLLVENAE